MKPFYADKVKFYANKRSKRIIVVHLESLGKGWYQLFVGDKTKKSRNSYEVDNLLRKYYPNYIPISLFSELNYHSALNDKIQGKITNYGNKDYTLEYSSFKPIDIYVFEQPIKSGLKKEFGKIRKRVTLLEWNYIVLDWVPNKGLFIKHSISNSFGKKEIIYKSKLYSFKDKDIAIKDFKKYVNKVIG